MLLSGWRENGGLQLLCLIPLDWLKSGLSKERGGFKRIVLCPLFFRAIQALPSVSHFVITRVPTQSDAGFFLGKQTDLGRGCINRNRSKSYFLEWKKFRPLMPDSSLGQELRLAT